MAKKGKKRRAREAADPLTPSACGMAEALAAETDRGCPLVAAERLSEALAFQMRCDFEGTGLSPDQQYELLERDHGILETFYARTKIARAFGLIPEQVAHMLDEVRAIRNHFAHWPGEVSYDDIETAPRVQAVETQVKQLVSAQTQDALAELWRSLCAETTFSPNRLAFMTAAACIHGLIVVYSVVERYEGHSPRSHTA